MTGHTVASRRAFLKTTALAGAALGGSATLDPANSAEKEQNAPASGKLKIKVAGYQYDRVEGLVDGRVQIAGCETQFETAKIGDMNTHAFSGPKTREVTEIGLLPLLPFATM